MNIECVGLFGLSAVIGNVANVALGLYMNANNVRPEYCIDCDGLVRDKECKKCHKPLCNRCYFESLGLCLECLVKEDNNEKDYSER